MEKPTPLNQNSDPKINRREFLQTVGAGMVALAGGEKAGKIKIFETPKENVELIISGKEWEMKGEGSDLSKLHNDVAQAFEGALDKEIKSRDYTIGLFTVHIGHHANGKYFLEYRVQLTPTENPKETHRIIGLFGKVWSGRESKIEARKLFDKGVGHWQKNMERVYSDMRFWTEEAEDGSDKVYHVACIMKGAKK